MTAPRQTPTISLRGMPLLAAACYASLVGATEARAATLLVDGDRAQCANAGFTSIQEAVDAARPGDTVRVCPDLYAEQ